MLQKYRYARTFKNEMDKWQANLALLWQKENWFPA